MALDIGAKQAILIEMDTNTILLNQNGDEIMFPASMTKMMTIYLLFERLKNGSLSLEDTFPVSEKAWRMGGSKMFVKVNERVKVEDLIQGIIVQSGNDATIVVAEGLAGSEDAFAEMMTKKAHELGMTHTTFRNASGWPNPEHVTTAHDLARLAMATIRNFPEYYHYYSELSFTHSGITQGNRNPLLYKNIGADGLKTGHTEVSGYGLTASAVRNGRRLVMVANGFKSEKARSDGGERLIDWGFREFDNYALFKAGEKVVDAQVWLGTEPTVAGIIEKPLTITIPRKSRADMKVTVNYNGPIPAPIAKGAQIGTVVITAPDVKTMTLPIVAAQAVGQLGPVGRLGAALKHLVWGGGQ